MKKFMMDAKSSLGLAPKTVDEEFEKKAAALKDVETNVRAYSSAASRMTSAVNSFSTALESMSKAFEDMAKTEGAPEAAKSVATEYAAAVKKIKDEYDVEFKKAMDQESSLKSDIDACKKVGNDRSKAMADYDTYRAAVSKKEEDYKKKNKDLSESKLYDDEVKKRDEFQSKYDALNTEYKTKADACIAGNSAFVSKCMTDFLNAASTLLTAMQKDIATIQESAKQLPS